MNTYQLIKTLSEKADFELFNTLPKLLYEKDSQRFTLGHNPSEEHLEGCYVLLRNNEPVGRFALYCNPHLEYNNKMACCLGSYECVNNSEIAKKLIDHAIERAKQLNYKYLIGPMEGSTWNSYRFSVHNEQPNFFMEPYHHVYYNQQFEASGFSPIAHYVSNLDATLEYDLDRLEKLEKHYLERGAIMRNLNMGNLETDLFNIARFSNDAFANNFLYTPIDEDEFVRKYLKLKPLFNPDLVWIVEDTSCEMQALSFSIKDYNDPEGKTLIIKSLARLSGSTFGGIGGYLASKTNLIAKTQGFEKIIHALMIDDNASVRISEKHAGEAFKTYALYGLAL